MLPASELFSDVLRELAKNNPKVNTKNRRNIFHPLAPQDCNRQYIKAYEKCPEIIIPNFVPPSRCGKVGQVPFVCADLKTCR